MEFIQISPENLSSEEIYKLIRENIQTARKMRAEIASFNARKKVESKVEEEQDESEQEEAIEVQEISTIPECLMQELAKYYPGVKTATVAELSNNITELLPQADNKYQSDIINWMKAQLLRSIKEIKEYLHTETTTEEECAELKAEIAELQDKIYLLDESLETQEVEEEQETEVKQNRLIFIPTSGGSIRVLQDLKSIDQEYYAKFLGLFTSIKNNTFKNAFTFSNHPDWKGISAVKDFKVRVCYSKLTSDTYAVITAFLKKSDYDKYSQKSLTSNIAEFRAMEQSIRNNLENEEFLREQEFYERELFQMLSSGTKAKGYALKKDGE